MKKKEFKRILRFLPSNTEILVEGEEPTVEFREVHKDGKTCLQVNLYKRPKE